MPRPIRRITAAIRVFGERPPDPNNYIVGGTKRRILVDTCSTLNGNPYADNKAFAGLDGIVFTHPHFDHAAGVKYFPEVPLYAHADAAAALEAGDSRIQQSALFGKEACRRRISRALSDGDILDLGGASFMVISTPGHCAGAICLYEPASKALITGDTVFTGGSLPRTDLPSSDAGALADSYEKLLALEVEWILPGHGAVSRNGSQVIGDSLKALKSRL